MMTMSLIILWSFIQTASPKRILDIYTKNRSENSYREQIKLLAADPQGLKERDVVIREHTGDATFKITLTGKDGGIKYTATDVLQLKKLYAIIDAMPMRKDEMGKP